MANMTCPSCNRTISRIATSCPFCGQSLKKMHPPVNNDYYQEDQEYREPEKEFIFPAETDPRTPDPATRSAVKKRLRQPKSGSPGRKLIGYRSGHFLNRCISMIYHISAVLVLVWAYAMSSEYFAKDLGMFHILRTTLGALILFLPALLLSDTTFHRCLPLIRSKSSTKITIGFLLFLVPLVLLFSYTCILCNPGFLG